MIHEWLRLLQEFWNNLQTGAIHELGSWSYVALLVLVATEGPLSTLVGAAAAATGLLDVRWVLLATIGGNIIGDVVWYTVGYLHKLDTLFHYGKWLGVKRSHLDRLEAQMHAHATKMIVIAKIAYGLIVPTLVAAGLARVPWRKWFPMVFVVETVWSILLVYLGYHMTGYIAQLERGFEIGVAVVWLILIAGVVIWLRKRKRRIVEPVDPAQLPPQPSHVPQNEEPSEHRNHLMQHDVNGISVSKHTMELAVRVQRIPDAHHADLRGAPVGEIGGKGPSA
jgi:membrane protein DedA with SNARE-associated domain